MVLRLWLGLVSILLVFFFCTFSTPGRAVPSPGPVWTSLDGGDDDDGDRDDDDGDCDDDDGDHDDDDGDHDDDDGDHDDDDGDRDDDDGDCDRITSFCEGDETCPCDNPSESGGCENSTGAGGRLETAGTTSVAADDLVIAAVDLPVERFTVLFMGSAAIAEPMTIGNGRRCVGGRIFRFRKASSGELGRVQFGPGLVETSCTTFPPEGCILAGSTWYFQAWYRDGVHGDCVAGFNTTDALEITFRP